MYWHQHSLIKWLQLGDKNSRFFHLSTIHRRQRNQITKLKDAHGVWKTETKEIAGIIQDHFHSLYCSPPARDFDDIIGLVDPLVTPEINCAFVKIITREEICLAAFQIGSSKSPRVKRLSWAILSELLGYHWGGHL